jgi:hypothetical protein
VSKRKNLIVYSAITRSGLTRMALHPFDDETDWFVHPFRIVAWASIGGPWRSGIGVDSNAASDLRGMGTAIAWLLAGEA